MIDGHGDDLYRYGDKVRHNFSSNIVSRDSDPELVRFLAGHADSLFHYPEPRAFTLERLIAAEAGVGAENVLVAAGATELIYMAAQAHRGGRAAIVSPAFSEYEDACRMNGVEVEFCDSLSEAVNTGARLIWVCSPSNPGGQVIPHDELTGCLRLAPDAFFIVDQAYGDYTTRRILGPAEAVELGNVVVLQSLTKRFSVPGLRIGYAIGAVGELARFLRPWSVNAVGAACAGYLIANQNKYSIDAQALHSEALRVADAFRKMGILTYPTDCNFFLAELPDRTAAELKDRLVENHGILIRDASNFHGLSPRHFRIAVQTPPENDMLIEAIKRWITN